VDVYSISPAMVSIVGLAYESFLTNNEAYGTLLLSLHQGNDNSQVMLRICPDFVADCLAPSTVCRQQYT